MTRCSACRDTNRVSAHSKYVLVEVRHAGIEVAGAVPQTNVSRRGTALSLPDFVNRQIEACAVRHPDIERPWITVWRKTAEWDRTHTNNEALWASELDRDRLEMALELYRSDETAAAFEIWLDLAEGGSIWAMTEIGSCYESGTAVPQDLIAAERWFARAAAGGSLIAMIYRAKCAGYRKDYAAAVEVLEPGVNQGWLSALFWQTWYRQILSPTLKTYRSILPVLKKAKREGHPGATFLMANWMASGKFGWWLVPVGAVRLVLFAIKMVGPPPRWG